MIVGKGSHEEEEYRDDEFGPRRDDPCSNSTVHCNNDDNNNIAANKDAKNSDKAAIRSKHSVTEQRRRSKINERFQILRELIPHSDQKRDTASFLLEVIEYAQYLQEKVQKYEGSYPGWSPEPTKLIPWRNTHWRVQGFANHPHTINNGSGPGTPFPGKFKENNMTTAPAFVPGAQNPAESEPGMDVAYRQMDRQPELVDSKGLSLSMSVAPTPQPSHSAQSNESPARSDVPCQTEELVIEGGTINISSVYSHELLSSLTQALQKAGIDLSHARLSVQIGLGKQPNQGPTFASLTAKDQLSDNQGIPQPKDPNSEDESDHSHKRVKKT
ncbi:PREDICTED: transcription factor BIM2 [Tarenaya hassleriana]|uniref:transcription factor BIM2 n=1 Tax=Tarenaya hassleriana TaxID=28532 RepID=UPI00053CA18A|nr:PREDICTED: transcription factor BIM2 [Tarenaya hassleriana]